jgi:hypothetical protein
MQFVQHEQQKDREKTSHPIYKQIRVAVCHLYKKKIYEAELSEAGTEMIYHSEKSDDESTTVSFYPSITI